MPMIAWKVERQGAGGVESVGEPAEVGATHEHSEVEAAGQAAGGT